MRLALNICWVLAWLLWAIPAFANPKIMLTDYQSVITVNTQLDFLHDPDGGLTIHELASPALAERFSNTGRNGFYVGLTYDTYWLRISFDNQSSSLLHWYLQVYGMDEAWVEIYLQRGKATPIKLDPEPYFHYHTYPLDLLTQGQYTIYVQVKDRNDALSLGFNFAQAEQRVNIHAVILYTLITGGLLALGLYNLFLFASLRHASYGWLGLAILANNLENSRYTGLLHQYLPIWPEYYQLYAVFGFFSLLGYIAFLRDILATRQYLPIFDRAFQVLFWVTVGTLVNLVWLPFAALWYTILGAFAFFFTAITVFQLSSTNIKLNKKLRWGFIIFILGGIPALMNGLFTPASFMYGFPLLLLTIFLFALMLSLSQADHVHLLRDEAARAQAANQAKGEFLTTMSHELRTPMNAVMGSSMLLRDTILTAQQRNYVDKLEIASQHMLTLIGDILDISRIEQQAFSLEQIPFDLQVIATELDALFIEPAMNKGVAFRVAGPANSLWLVGDPLRLKQVLMNLLSNAIKFTESGQIECSMLVKHEDAEKVVVNFMVVDSGIGIAPEQQTYLFQRFSQADSSTSRRYGGSGLGLSISAQLVKQMGGEVSLKSALGQGSRFEFQLVFSVPEIIPTLPTATSSLALKLPSAHILLVDDDRLNQFFTQAVLEKLGMQVSVVSDGAAAIQQVQQQDFALVFMDVSMPDMDGYETTRRIRAIPNLIKLPIIALTAHVIAGERERCLAAGMNGFLCNPYQMVDLQTTLQYWLCEDSIRSRHISVPSGF